MRERIFIICTNQVEVLAKFPKFFKGRSTLGACLKEEWEKIPLEVTKKLVDSMPQRLTAVIKAKGGPTKY